MRSFFGFIRPGRLLAATCLLAFPAALLAYYGPAGPPALTAHSGANIVVGSTFTSPFAVAVDASGDVFVADFANSEVKEVVAVNGVVSSISAVNIVGSGFSFPSGVAVDSAGNVFVADTVHNVVKEILAVGGLVSSTSIVNTIGIGFNHPRGVAVDVAGNVFVGDSNNNEVKELVAVGGVVPNNSTGTIVGSGFSDPYGVAVDSAGNVFVADNTHYEVKEIVAAGGVVSAGSPVNIIGSGFNVPYGVAVDSSGDVFVADANANAVKEIVAVGGVVSAGSTVSTISTGGLNNPYGVAVDSHGLLYAADSGNNRVVEVLPANLAFRSLPVATGTPTTLALTFTFDTAGTGVTEAVSTQGAPGLDFTDLDTGTCYTNTASHTYASGDTCTVNVTFTPSAPGMRYGAAQLLNASHVAIATGYVNGTGLAGQATLTPGIITTVAGNGSTTYNGDGELATAAGLVENMAVRLDAKGNLYIADATGARIRKVDAVTGVISTVAGIGTAGFSGDGGLATSARLLKPNDVAVDGAGNMYIADEGNNRVRRVDAVTGKISTVVGTGTASDTGDGGQGTAATIYQPYTVLCDSAGNLYMAGHGEQVRKLTVATGVITLIAGTGVSTYSGDGGLAVAATLDSPYALAFDSLGNLFIADAENSVIRRVDAATGIITTVVGNGTSGYTGDGGQALNAEFTEMFGLAIDSANNIYVADADNNRIRKIDALTGIVTTVAGSSVTGGFAGDGGPATAALLNLIVGLAVDGAGNLYISDYNNNRVRKVAAGIAAFGSYAEGVSSPAIDVTLSNSGNVALDLSAVTASTNFNLAGSDTSCSSSSAIASGADCILGIEFLPTAVGSLTGTVTVTPTASNVAGATVTLSGTATAPVAALVAFAGVPTTVAAGGNLGTVTVSVESLGGIVITGSSASITVTITGPGGYSQTVTGTAASGVASLNLSSLALTTPGTYTVTASSASLTSAIATVIISAGAASQLVTSAVPATVAGGGNLGTLGVTIKDAYGNVVTTSAAAVTVTITGPGGYSHTVTGNAVNGVASLNLSSLALTIAGTYTVTTSSTPLPSVLATVTVTAGAASQLVTGAIPATVASGGNLGTLVVTIKDAYGNVVTTSSAAVTVTTTGPGGYSQTVTGTAASGVASLNLSSLVFTAVGTYTVTTTSGSLTGVQTFVVARALSGLTFSASPTTQLATMAVVFTAEVNSATAGVPTGTISFLNGSTVLATVTIVPGQPAVYSETGLASGTYSVTASYSGDGSFLPSASTGAPVSITISTLDLALGGDNNKTVVPGAAVTYNFPLSPVLTPTFLYTVALTATGLPPGATYTFSPASIPAGSGPIPVAFTVQTAATTGMLRASKTPKTPWFALLFGLLLPLAGAKRFRSRMTILPRVLMLLLFGALSLGLVAGLGGCGSGGFLGTPPGQTNYTITIVATSGTLVRTSTVQLNLE